MELNIYEKNDEGKKVVVKTYTADTYELDFGTVEDLINLLDLDKLAGLLASENESAGDIELIKIIGKMIVGIMPVLKPLLKDIFDGLTDEEIRHAKTSEIAKVLVIVIKFTMAEIGGSATGKN